MQSSIPDELRASPDPSKIAAEFARIAVRRPDQPAIRYDGATISYARLRSSADALSERLQQCGAGQGAIVAVYLPRSIEFIVALLAVLNTGAAYAPLEPGDPPARVRQHLAILRPRLVLTSADGAGAIATADGRTVDEVINVAAMNWHVLSVRDDGAANRLNGDVACLMSTSGSHGAPKHVAVPHRGILNLARNDTFSFLNEDDVFLFHSPASFDASTFEIWACLLNGGTLVIPKNQRLTLNELANLLVTMTVTTLWLPSALFAAMVDFEMASLRGLRTLITGGDVVPASAMQRAFSGLPGVRLMNGYGPTECTTFACCFVMSADYLSASSIPIGRALANVVVGICDKQDRPVLRGVEGEVLIAGPGLGAGYLNQPKLTRAAFVSLCSHAGQLRRFYRTGDIARELPDGNIEFLGRRDNQIKLRGFRIEIEEIERAIDACPEVGKSAVHLEAAREGDEFLVATIVPKAGRTVGVASEPRAADFRERYVSQWRSVYDAKIYRDLFRNKNVYDDTFNITGWTSSYTDAPLSVEEMELQVAETSRRILSGQPQRILEIGCGSGLLTHRLIGHCEAYVGIDISGSAVTFVSQSLASIDPAVAARVEIRQWPAHRIAELGLGTFDALVLNSVVQHFPDIEYLRLVLGQCAHVARPGAMIFLGDIRCLSLHRAFHVSLQLHRSSPELRCKQLLEIVDQKVAREQELLIDPAFFRDGALRPLGIAASSIHLKRGRRLNELNLFRYDVLLHAAPAPARPQLAAEHDWHGQPVSLEKLKMLVTGALSIPIVIRDIPNARVTRDVAATRLLDSVDAPATMGQLLALAQGVAGFGLDPEDVCAMAEALNRQVCIGWPASNRPDHFDVEVNVAIENSASPIDDDDSLQVPAVRANRPSLRAHRDGLETDLRAYLAERLPAYMIPARFIWSDALPIDERGKLNRSALAATKVRSPMLTAASIERLVRETWAAELDEDVADSAASFFELGGTSLSAIRVAAKLGRSLGIHLPAHTIFENMTIRNLSSEILARLERNELVRSGTPR